MKKTKKKFQPNKLSFIILGSVVMLLIQGCGRIDYDALIHLKSFTVSPSVACPGSNVEIKWECTGAGGKVKLNGADVEKTGTQIDREVSESKTYRLELFLDESSTLPIIVEELSIEIMTGTRMIPIEAKGSCDGNGTVVFTVEQPDLSGIPDEAVIVNAVVSSNPLTVNGITVTHTTGGGLADQSGQVPSLLGQRAKDGNWNITANYTGARCTGVNSVPIPSIFLILVVGCPERGS